MSDHTRRGIDDDALLVEDAAELGLALSSLPTRRVETVELPEGRLRAIRWGDGEPALSLLHGGGMNAFTWNALLLLLGRSALAIDLPGHGDSDWRTDADYSPQRLAPGVAAALGQIAPGARPLVGHSLGGLTAIGVADLRPDLVSRLVLIDVTPGIGARGPSQVREFLAGPESFASVEEIVERATAHRIGRSAGAVRRGALRNTRVRDDGRLVWKHHLAQLPESVSPNWDFTPLWELLQRVRVPVTLVAGGHGYLDAEDLAAFVEKLPGSGVVVLETGHNVHQDDPEALAAVLAGLLGP